ncbi:beta-lactamase HcpA precursor [mine drainage metagenome]|uniref:Beta-lactamase HcpA n=1 Tax=mine drainage metagenome TaxID=410659 RepID=A0A1J5SYR9_9ZZZZ
MRKLIFCLFILLWSGLAAAELSTGMAAYNNGDMKTAAAEFQKLPQKSGFVLYTLGVIFENGQGVTKDGKAAAEWYRQAAELKSSDKLWAMLSEHNLGVMYAKGEGVPQDYIAAMGWYLKAAESGHAPSQFNLGVMYAKGEGTPVDYAQAKKWLNRAAAAGDKKALELSKTLEKETATKQIAVPLGTVQVVK